MIDYHKELRSALNKVLPAHYEMALTSKTTTPCISYMELSNVDTTTGETLGYSRLVFQVKVWSNEIEEIQKYALEIDLVLRPLGFKRTAANELYDKQSTMIQKIMTYEANALEEYTGGNE
jgi:hypothetical protein